MTLAEMMALSKTPKTQVRAPRTPQFLCPDCGKSGFNAGDVAHTKGCSLSPQFYARKRASVAGLSVCMTGFRDAEMEQGIVAAGGSIASGVSKNLGFLVAKDPHSTSGKAQRARELGIPVLSIAQMNARLRSAT